LPLYRANLAQSLVSSIKGFLINSLTIHKVVGFFSRRREWGENTLLKNQHFSWIPEFVEYYSSTEILRGVFNTFKIVDIGYLSIFCSATTS